MGGNEYLIAECTQQQGELIALWTVLYLEYVEVTHDLSSFIWEESGGSYKTRNGTEPEVIDAQYGGGRRIRDVLMSAHHGAESSSCVLYQP